MASTLDSARAGERLRTRFRRFIDRMRALLSLPAALDIRLSQVQTELGRQMDQGLTELKAELSAQVSFSLHDFEAVLSGQKQQLTTEQRAQVDAVLSALRILEGAQSLQAGLLSDLRSRFDGMKMGQIETVLNDLGSQIKSLQNSQFEMTNRLIHLDTSLHTRLNTLENEQLASISEDIHQLTALHFELHSSMRERSTVEVSDSKRRKERADPQPFERILEQAKNDFPRIFPLWAERLEEMQGAFLETKVGNAAHAGDSASRVFRSFVELNAIGRLLDVGCGIFGLPYYLASYPEKLVSGIDPLQPTAAMQFEFVRGLSEYLPWPDDSFSTVVSATSLDHCLSLERSLAEIRRVLRPGGRFLLWIASIAGAPRYQPDREDFVPADRFHLFHFDVSWFQPVLEDTFSVAERVELHRKDYSHVIYSLIKK